ncbi:MAG: cyclic nucleotide-binding domain-containing protein [Thermodesulfobacteriota bacterium]
MKDAQNAQRSPEKQEAIYRYLATLPLFDGMEPEELGIVAAHMHLFSAEEGDLVFEEGEKGNYVCFVVGGILDVIKDAASGERAQIAELSAGDSIGEMAVVDNFPRSATVVAKTPATLLTMTSTDFNQLLLSHPAVGIKILKGIARILSINLRKTSSQLADYMLPVM